MTARDLKIKTGVVKRTFKELQGYQKEESKQKERIEKLIASEADEYDVRKQVLAETVQIIPDCKKRLESASQDLRQFLDKHQDLASTEDGLAAESVLTECSQY